METTEIILEQQVWDVLSEVKDPEIPAISVVDLGIISAGVAIAMIYVAISSELDIDLGWFKLKKKGLSSEQQKEVATKTLPQVAKAIAGVGG